MSILVIGGAGFIGASLVRKLVAARQDVVCMDTNIDPWHLGAVGAQIEVVRGDMVHFDELAATIVVHRVDQIICVAYMLAGASEAALHAGVRVNVLGLDNVFEAARLAGIKRVLFASSVTYHGTNPSPSPVRITEDSPANPLGAYGWQKQFNEAMAARYASQFGMTIAAVRPPIVFGPGRRQGHIGHAQLINEPALGNQIRLAAPTPLSSMWMTLSSCFSSLPPPKKLLMPLIWQVDISSVTKSWRTSSAGLSQLPISPLRRRRSVAPNMALACRSTTITAAPRLSSATTCHRLRSGFSIV